MSFTAIRMVLGLSVAAGFAAYKYHTLSNGTVAYSQFGGSSSASMPTISASGSGGSAMDTVRGLISQLGLDDGTPAAAEGRSLGALKARQQTEGSPITTLADADVAAQMAQALTLAEQMGASGDLPAMELLNQLGLGNAPDPSQGNSLTAMTARLRAGSGSAEDRADAEMEQQMAQARALAEQMGVPGDSPALDILKQVAPPSNDPIARLNQFKSE